MNAVTVYGQPWEGTGPAMFVMGQSYALCLCTPNVKAVSSFLFIVY